MKRTVKSKAAVMLAVAMSMANITAAAAPMTAEPDKATPSNADRNPAVSGDDLVDAVVNVTENLLSPETEGKLGENIDWVLEEDGTLRISGKGEILDDSGEMFSEFPWYAVRSHVTKLVIGEGITVIGDDAFARFSNLKSAKIPSTVTEIRANAFFECAALADIIVPDTVATVNCFAFYGCDSLPDSTPVSRGSKDSDRIFHWNMTKGGTLTLYGKGEMPNYSSCYEVASNDDIREVIIEDGITSISSYLFVDCVNLKRVQIPDTVTSIGDEAFRGCESLTDIKIPDGVTSFGRDVFEGCTSLTIETPDTRGTWEETIQWVLDKEGTLTVSGSGSMEKMWSPPWDSSKEDIKKVVIGDKITAIGSNAFSDCSNLSEVHMTASVTSIGDFAFMNCHGMKEFDISHVKTLGKDAFTGTVMEGRTPLARGTYGDNLEWELDRQGTLIIQGDGEMKGDSHNVPWKRYKDDIAKLDIKKGVTTIEDNAFEGFVKLTEVVLPESGMTAIGNLAFYGCRQLAVIKIPSDIAAIADGAFLSCDQLPAETIVAKDSYENTFFWERTKGGVLTISGTGEMPYLNVSLHLFRSAEDVTKLVVKEGVANIRPNDFNGCKNLASVELPSSLTSIGHSAFKGCVSLTGIDIPKNVTIIDEEAFSGCTNLASVKLSEGIQEIRRLAFNPSAVTSVVIPRTVVFLEQTAFPAGTKMTFEKLGDLTSTPLELTNNGRPLGTRNQHRQNYIGNWNDVVNSYLYRGEDGSYYRVEYKSGNLIIEQFDSGFAFVKSWDVPMELPVFGGFYAGENQLFVAFGKNNMDEDSKAEVLRVVKYSTDMRRLDSVSYYGINTQIPFRAGTMRMDETDKELYVHTAHQMFVSLDGKNHQANMTFVINKESMIPSYSRYYTSGNGGVSHSFNQFIKVDGSKVVTADHGDSSPRALCLTVFGADDMGGDLEAEDYIVLAIPGEGGDNYTGVEAGGMEFSHSSYLVAGNSIDLSDYSHSKTKNIFLTVTDKSDLSAEPKYIPVTDYPEGSSHNVSTPHLVKLSENEFALMWEEGSSGDTIKIAFFDGKGDRLGGGGTGTISGSLSDCQPIVEDGKVIWYVTAQNNLTFYSFPAQVPAAASDVKAAAVTVKTKSDSSGDSGADDGSGSGSGGGSGNGSGGGGSGSGGGGSSSGGGGSSSGGGGGSSSGGGGGSKGTSGGPSGGSGSASPSSLPDYVVTGTWSEVNGQWQFRDSSGQDYTGRWAAVYNPYANTAAGQSAFDWFRFDASGNMVTGWFQDTDGCFYYLNPDSDGTKGRMLTGWVWIADASGVRRCCYLNPNSDGYRGRLITNTVIDGYTINGDGYWTVNGVVQTK